MKHKIYLKHFLCCFFISGMFYGSGCTPTPTSTPTPSTSNVERELFDLRMNISFLNDSITKLNQKIDNLQQVQNKASQGKKGNNKSNITNKNKATAEAAIAKLNNIGFTQNDLDAAIKAAAEAGSQSQNQPLFSACQIVLNFCGEADKRKSLLQTWVNGGWPNTKGKFSDLPQNIQHSLKEFVNDTDKYNKYTKLTKKYTSLEQMMKEIDNW